MRVRGIWVHAYFDRVRFIFSFGKNACVLKQFKRVVWFLGRKRSESGQRHGAFDKRKKFNYDLGKRIQSIIVDSALFRWFFHRPLLDTGLKFSVAYTTNDITSLSLAGDHRTVRPDYRYLPRIVGHVPEHRRGRRRRDKVRRVADYARPSTAERNTTPAPRPPLYHRPGGETR